MRVKILKSFPFYPDGNTKHDAIAGTEEDVPDALIAGLSAAGYIQPVPPPEKPKVKSIKDEPPPRAEPQELAKSASAKPAAASPLAQPVKAPPQPMRSDARPAPLPSRSK